LKPGFTVNINGLEQYLEVIGENKNGKEVVLFIHGGPSWPATPMLRLFNRELAKNVTLVSWDQRNCGKSQWDSTGALSLDQYIEDAHQVTAFLKKKFHKEKIFIAGHSWGSIIGTFLVTKYPGDYAAYIGMGQIVNFKKSESLSRKWLAEQANLNHDQATLDALERISFSEVSAYEDGFTSLVNHRKLLSKYRGDEYDTTYEAKALNASPDYKGIDWMKSVKYASKFLAPVIFNTNFSYLVNYKVPVYYFAGRHDHNTMASMAETYFKTITAPKKEFFWFENSGHSPQWEEPSLFNQRLLQIIKDNSR
jgi:proline iminopeptidase